MGIKVNIQLDKFLKAIKDEFEELQESSNSRAEREGETPDYTDERVKSDISLWQDEAKTSFKVLGDAISSAALSLQNWAGSEITLEPVLGKGFDNGPIHWGDGYEDPTVRVTAEVFVHKGGSYKGSPSFTAFGEATGKLHAIDDVLDAGDSDFFKDPETEADYFQLTEELRNPGKARQQGNKIITLYTARPQKDRATYDNAKHIPVNVFLSTSENEALGYQREMKSRDVYYVKIKRMYLVETLNQGSLKNYQTFSGKANSVPVEECRIIDEGSKTASLIVARYVRALDEQAALDQLVNVTIINFLDELDDLNVFADKNITSFLENQGLTAEELNAKAPEVREAGPMIRALGGLVRQGLWFVLVRPFKLLDKFARSSAFRAQLKVVFYKALKRDVRASKHLLSVAGRLYRGEEVSAPERKEALKYLVGLIAKSVMIYFTGPQIAQAFTGPIWSVVSNLIAPVQDILYLLLLSPINAVAKRLMSDDLSL